MSDLVLPTLYSHQEELRDKVRDALKKHHRAIMCAPPGVGKTRLAKWILGASALREHAPNQTGYGLFAVQRRGLVDNASNSFNEEPRVRHGLIMSERKPAYGARTQVASIDTLLSWFIQDGQYDTSITFDIIVYDETHAHLPKLVKFLNHHDAFRKEQGKHPAFVLGLSATPECKGLADVYRVIVEGPSTQWLIDNHYLAPYRYFGATKGKLGLLVRKGDEFTEDSVSKAMEGLSGALVRDWKKYAAGRPTVGFFPRRQHAQEAKADLESAGVRTAYVDGDTDDTTRNRIFWELNNGKLDYVCNVQVVERGTDIPRIGCVQLATAVGSVVRLRQMLGRGSRVHPEKVDCIVIDHGGSVQRLGFFEDDPKWSLDRSKGSVGDVAPRPTVECPKCEAIYRGGKCRNCGYEPTKEEYRGQGLEFDGTELKVLERKKKPTRVMDPEELMVKMLYAAGRSKRTWKQAVGMFLSTAKKQGTPYKVPKRVTIAGRVYRMLAYGDEQGGRQVGDLFPVTKGGGHGGRYLESSNSREGAT